MIKTKENKGITLIALIITIIVMLILVGVTVNVALNGGLFSTAKTAVTKTNRAVEEEKNMEIEMTIELEREEILKKFPLGNVRSINRTEDFLVLENLNILDAYEYILENYYNSSYETLNLSTALKAFNKLYQIYNPEVEDFRSGYGYNFWELMPDVELENGEEISQERNMQFSTIVLTYRLSSKETKTFITTNNGKTQFKILLGQEFISFISDLSSIYPGEAYPTDKIAGTATGDLSYLKLLNLEVRELNSNNISDITEMTDNSKNENKTVDPNDYLGKTAIVMWNDEEGSEKCAALCYDMILIDTKLGEIYYVDENGNSDKPLP